MDLQLTDKIALISGSTAGIGLAIATILAQEGATVVINGRKPERVGSAMDKIRQIYPEAKLQGVTADLSTAVGAELTFQQVPVVDILVNNVGFYQVKEFGEITDAL